VGRFFANFEARDNAHKYAQLSKYAYAYKHPYDVIPSQPEGTHTLSSFSAILTNFIYLIHKT